jgi:hypothetical protein
VTGRTRDALNRVAAKKTCPSMPRARSLARLRADGKTSAILAVGVDVVASLLERARAAARAIRARVAAVVDVDLAAVDVAAIAWVMHRDGFFHRRHLLAEARRHLALVLRGRLREPGLDERIADAALAAHRTDITEPRTQHGKNQEHRLCTTRWAPGPPPARRRPSTGPDPDHKPAPDPAASHLPLDEGEWPVPRDPLRYDRAVIASTVLSARLRTARRASRDPYPYDGFAHRQAALPEQLFLFGQQKEEPVRKKAGPVDVTALRTRRPMAHHAYRVRTRRTSRVRTCRDPAGAPARLRDRIRCALTIRRVASGTRRIGAPIRRIHRTRLERSVPRAGLAARCAPRAPTGLVTAHHRQERLQPVLCLVRQVPANGHAAENEFCPLISTAYASVIDDTAHPT